MNIPIRRERFKVKQARGGCHPTLMQIIQIRSYAHNYHILIYIYIYVWYTRIYCELPSSIRVSGRELHLISNGARDAF